MHNIKFYGGPLHGEIKSIPDELIKGVRRYETRERDLMLRRMALRQEDCFRPMDTRACYTTVTYYFRDYHMAGMTKEMARVHKDMDVAVLEGAQLIGDELYDLEYDMRHVPWVWNEEPSILYEFDKWWEKQLHDRKVKKVCPYC